MYRNKNVFKAYLSSSKICLGGRFLKNLNKLGFKKISILILAAVTIIGLLGYLLTSNNKTLFIKVPANIEA